MRCCERLNLCRWILLSKNSEMLQEFNYLDIIIKHSVCISITLQQLKGPLALEIFKLHKPKGLLSHPLIIIKEMSSCIPTTSD